MTGDRVFERILLPIAKYITMMKRQKPSEVPKAFGAENERKYSIPGALAKKYINNLG